MHKLSDTTRVSMWVFLYANESGPWSNRGASGLTIANALWCCLCWSKDRDVMTAVEVTSGYTNRNWTSTTWKNNSRIVPRHISVHVDPNSSTETHWPCYTCKPGTTIKISCQLRQLKINRQRCADPLIISNLLSEVKCQPCMNCIVLCHVASCLVMTL